MSWTGRILVIKMNIVSRLFFLLQAIIYVKVEEQLHDMQWLLSPCAWERRRTKVKASDLYRFPKLAGVTIPHVKLYVQIFQLRGILNWLGQSQDKH